MTRQLAAHEDALDRARWIAEELGVIAEDLDVVAGRVDDDARWDRSAHVHDLARRLQDALRVDDD